MCPPERDDAPHPGKVEGTESSSQSPTSIPVNRAPDGAVRLTISVDDTADWLGISRALAYEGVKSGAIPSIRVGRRWLVPVAALRRLVGEDAA